MSDIISTTGSHHFPLRKNKFKKMVGKICSREGSNKSKDSKESLLLQNLMKANESTNWLSKNPKRWKRFQKQYQHEFDEKIKLMDEIRDRKKDDDVIQSLFSLEDSDF
ncbi:MAG: hypothetical protein Q4P17_02395 [Methanobacterium sp.]|nr:hypothetical protein [Methanobacterium sp.]